MSYCSDACAVEIVVGRTSTDTYSCPRHLAMPEPLLAVFITFVFLDDLNRAIDVPLCVIHRLVFVSYSLIRLDYCSNLADNAIHIHVNLDCLNTLTVSNHVALASTIVPTTKLSNSEEMSELRRE